MKINTSKCLFVSGFDFDGSYLGMPGEEMQQQFLQMNAVDRPVSRGILADGST